MKKVISLMLAVIMAIMLTACAGNPDETNSIKPNSDKNVSGITGESGLSNPDENVSSDPDETAYTTIDWQYYIETGHCDSRTMGEFLATWQRYSNAKTDAFNSFLNQLVSIEDCVSELKKCDDEYYQQIVDIYRDTASDKHPDVSISEFERMRSLYFYEIITSLEEIKYENYWDDFGSAVEYCNGQWSIEYSQRYANGVFELDDDYWCWVEWYQNIAIPEGQNDKNAQEHRMYQVENPNEDAYLLLRVFESGYRMIHIVP